MKILKITIFIAWLAIVYAVSQVDQMAAYGLVALTVLAMIPHNAIDRMS